MNARMTWNPDAPTSALRVTLLAYLREQRDGLGADIRHTTKREELRRWIAWLDGGDVNV